MTRLLSAEALKLRSTRTSWALAAAAILLAGGVTAAVASSAEASADVLAASTSPSGIALTVALVLGVLVVTTEFRHGTITASLLAQPRRERLLLAKLGVAAATGLGFGLLAFGLTAALATTVLDARGIATGADAGTTARMVLGGGLACAAFAAVGVGVGALVRNQVGAVIGTLVWLYVVEQLLSVVPGVGDAVERFGLVGLASAATGTATRDPGAAQLAQGPALLVLALWVAVLVVGGAVVLRRRDVHGR